MKTKVSERNLTETAVAALQLQRALESLEADRAKEEAAIKEKYAKEEKELKKSLKGLTEALEAYVVAKQDELFEGESRFIDVGGVRLGLRLNPLAVTKTGKEKWEEIAEKMRAAGSNLVRIKPEVDREGILREWGAMKGSEFFDRFVDGLASYNLAVTQEETFYVKEV